MAQIFWGIFSTPERRPDEKKKIFLGNKKNREHFFFIKNSFSEKSPKIFPEIIRVQKFPSLFSKLVAKAIFWRKKNSEFFFFL